MIAAFLVGLCETREVRVVISDGNWYDFAEARMRGQSSCQPSEALRGARRAKLLPLLIRYPNAITEYREPQMREPPAGGNRRQSHDFVVPVLSLAYSVCLRPSVIG